MEGSQNRVLHDLRTVAAVIEGASGQLQDPRTSPATARRLAEMIQRRSRGLVRLIEDLAVLGEGDRGELRVALQPVDVADLCSATIADGEGGDRQP